MRSLWAVAIADGRKITIPTVVLAEWHREQRQRCSEYLAACDVEDLTRELAERAGEAIAAVTGATTVDAIVAASAAVRGDVVLTSDVDDLERLREHFRSIAHVVRV